MNGSPQRILYGDHLCSGVMNVGRKDGGVLNIRQREMFTYRIEKIRKSWSERVKGVPLLGSMGIAVAPL